MASFVRPSSGAAEDHSDSPGGIPASAAAPSTHYEQLLYGLVQANQRLLTEPHLRVAVLEVLAFLGEATAADRAYVFKNHPHPETGDLATSLRFEWTRPGGTTSQPHWQNLAYQETGLGRWLTTFAAGKSIHGRVADLPAAEQVLLRRDGILTLVWVPVFVDAHLWGAIGFDSAQRDQPWSEAERAILQAAADSLGGAIARQQTLEALRASQLRLKKLSDNLPGILYQCKLTPDGQLSFPFASEGCRTILGLDPDQMDRAMAQVHASDQRPLMMAIHRSAQTLAPFQHEWRIWTPEGVQKWVQGIAQPEVHGDGAIVWDGVLLDISDRKAAETLQQQQAQEFHSIWESVEYGLYVLDVLPEGEFRFVRFNPVVDRTSPIPTDQLLGKTLSEAFPPAVAERYRQRYRTCAENRQSLRFEDFLDGKDGRQWWLVNLTPFSNAMGTVTQILATVTDITEVKLAQQQQQESYALLNSVINGTTDLIFVKDRAGRYLLTNNALQVGLAPEQASLVGQDDFALYVPEIAATIQATDRQVMARGAPQTFEQTVPIGGEERTFLITKTPYYNAAQEVQGVIGISRDITERKRVEDTLKLFQQAVESSSDAICIIDTDLVQVYQNQAFADLFGYGSVEDFNREAENIFAIYADPNMAAYIFNRVHSEGSYSGEVMMRSRQRRLIPALLRANAIRDDHGTIVGTIRTYTDISDRKAAEARLQIQEQFLRSIYDGIEDSIFVLSLQADGEIIYTSHNRAAEVATGINSDSVTGKTPEAVFGPEAGQAIRAQCQRCIDSGTALTVEEQLIFKGQPVWRLATFNPLRDLSGRVHRIVGTSIDITRLKQAQAELKYQAQLSAFRAEIDSILTRGEKLRAMLQRCTEVIVGQMDAAFARIWTLNGPEQMLELQASAGLYTHIDGGHARVPVGRFKIGRIAQERCPHLSNDIRNDDRLGDPAWAEREGMVAFAGYPLIVDDELLGVVALFARQPLPLRSLETLGLVADEIALGIKRKQTEEQLQASEAKLRQRAQELKTTLQELQKAQAQLVQSEKMSSLGQLVAGVAHEINNPVNFIYGNLNHARSYTEELLALIQLYQTHYPTPEAAIEAEIQQIDLPFLMEDLPKLLQSMKVGAERIQDIVSSLRIFSRMDEAEMKAVDIHQGLDSTLMILQNRIKAGPDTVEVTLDCDYGTLPLVECYAGQLNQVFMNILSNALDALEEQRHGSPDAQPTIRIATCLLPDQQVRIAIADNGPGVPEAVRDRLFDPFFTTKPIGKGTGMGLSISYQVVTEKHGGTLTCDSTVGEGTTFFITIPLHQSRPR